MDENIQAIVDELLAMVGAASETTSAPAEAYEEPTPAIDGATPDEMRSAMDYVMDQLDVPEADREAYYDNVEAADEAGVPAFIENLNIVVNNTNIDNDTDNRIILEEDAEAGNITQHNDTTNANATGDGAVAGEDLHGAQVVTGEGASVAGDGNSGVNFGENSGQVAGANATADDFVGDGSVNNEGHIDDSAFGLGENSTVTNTANDSEDYSTNNTGNTDGSYNYDSTSETSDSFNHSSSVTESVDIDAHVDAGDGYGHDDYKPEEPEYDHGHDHEHEADYAAE